MTDAFPAIVRKNGTSKSVTIPIEIANRYKIGSTVKVTLETE